MSAALRLYYNRKSAPKARPQVISEMSSKLDRTNSPFTLESIPVSPFALDMNYANDNDNDNQLTQNNIYTNFNYSRSMTSNYRNFSTRVASSRDQVSLDTLDWKQQMRVNMHSSKYNKPGSLEEEKTGSQDGDSVRPPSSVDYYDVEDVDVETAPTAPTTLSTMKVLEAMANCGDWQGCMHLIRTSPVCDIKWYEIALRCCSRASGEKKGDFSQVFSVTPADEAIWLFREIQSKHSQGEKPSTEMVIYLMKALANDNRATEAMRLFQQHDVTKGTKILTQALQACSLASQQSFGTEQDWSQATLELFKALKSKANLIHANMVVRSLAGGGHLEQAVEFVENTLRTRFVPDDYTWCHIFWGCSLAHCLSQEGGNVVNNKLNHSVGTKLAMELFEELRKTETKPMSSVVFASAIRAVIGDSGPSQPRVKTNEYRVDSETGKAMDLKEFKANYGPVEGNEKWKVNIVSNAEGMWRRMVAAGYAPSPDLTAGLMIHLRKNGIRTNDGSLAEYEVAKQLTKLTVEDFGGEDGGGWRTACILDEECMAMAMGALKRAGDGKTARKLGMLRNHLKSSV